MDNSEILQSLDKCCEFYLYRIEDESGLSGIGVVARGVILPSGKCVLEWQTFHTSLGIYNNINDIEKIHGHHGKTVVIMGNPQDNPYEQSKKRSRKKVKKNA